PYPPLFRSAARIFHVGARLYDARTGFWAAIAYATTPGISFSSALISTDVPLLFFWTAALAAWIALQERRSWLAAIVLGAAIGLGLMSIYAMVYFLLCAAVWLFVDKPSRWLLRDGRRAVVLIVAALIFTPNILWNIDNGLVTFAHTAG